MTTLASHWKDIEGVYVQKRVVIRKAVRREDQMGDTTEDLVIAKTEHEIPRSGLEDAVERVSVL